MPGAVRFTRRFHAPTNLDQGTTVWLAIDALDAPATVTLNGRLLSRKDLSTATEPWSDGEVQKWYARFNITGVLQRQNALAIECISPASSETRVQSALRGLVRLEIEAATQS